MKSDQPILIYILAFLVLSIFLKIIGVINFNIGEIIGYALIFYGISRVYVLFGTSQKLKLAFNTFLFFAGMFLFVINNFEFVESSEVIFPSLLFMISGCFLMVFIEDLTNVKLLLIAVIFLLGGLLYSFYTGEPSFGTFINSIGVFFSKYWPALLIIGAIFVLISRTKE